MDKRQRRRQASENYSFDTMGGHPFLRWLVYEHTEPPINYDVELAKIANVKPNDTVVDLGFGNGYYFYNLYNLYGLRGRMIGVDPHPEQFEHAEFWGDDRSEWEEFKEWVEVVPSTMQDLVLPYELKADVVASNYSFYKLSFSQQEEVIAKVKGLLRPRDTAQPADQGGRFIVATSGWNNKQVQRHFEAKIAEYLTLATNTIHKPPKRMNRAFTSERAAKWLPEHFEHVRHIPMAVENSSGMLMYPHMVFYGEQIGGRLDVETYYWSLRTMADQFDPPPRGKQLDRAIQAVVAPEVEKMIEKNGYFADTAIRDVFECRGPKTPESPRGEVRIRSLGELALNT